MGTWHWPFGCNALLGVARRADGGRVPRWSPAFDARGVLGSALSLSQLPVLGTDSWGLLPVSCVPGMCPYESPAPAPQLTLLRAGVARCRGGSRASPREGVLCLHEGRLGLGARPPLAARSMGRQAGSASHLLRVRVCRGGDLALALWLACLAGRCAPQRLPEGAGGCSFCRCEGRLRLGAPPLSDTRPSGTYLGPVAGASWACRVCV